MGLIASAKSKNLSSTAWHYVKGTLSHFELDFLTTKAALTIKGEDSGEYGTRPPSWKFRVGLKLESVPMIALGSFIFFVPSNIKGRSFSISTQTTFFEGLRFRGLRSVQFRIFRVFILMHYLQ